MAVGEEHLAVLLDLHRERRSRDHRHDADRCREGELRQVVVGPPAAPRRTEAAMPLRVHPRGHGRQPVRTVARHRPRETPGIRRRLDPLAVLYIVRPVGEELDPASPSWAPRAYATSGLTGGTSLRRRV